MISIDRSDDAYLEKLKAEARAKKQEPFLVVNKSNMGQDVDLQHTEQALN